MIRATVLVAAAAYMTVGCATVRSVWQTPDEDRFKAGVRALAGGDYAKAHAELRWVAQHYANEDPGQRAMLILAAVELDARNPARRPEVGADLAATYLRLPDRDDWLDGIAQSLYLVGLELGTIEERMERAEAQQRILPKFPGPTVAARIKNVEQERDRLSKRVTALEAELAEKERELQRIRKTIKP